MRTAPSSTLTSSLLPTRFRPRWLPTLVLPLLAVLLEPTVARAQSYLLAEGFEGTANGGFESTGWTIPPNAISAPNPDYSTTLLSGTESLRCTGVSFIQRPFVNSDAFYCYFQVRWLALLDSSFVVDWLEAGGGSSSRVVTSGNNLELSHGSVSVTGTTTLSQNTTYHVWVEWTQGTGANGTMRLFISTTGLKPASPDSEILTGTGNAISFLDVGPFLAGADVLYDRILIDDVPIGDSPNVNSPPTISPLAPQSTPESTVLGPLAFTVGDVETDPALLTVTAASSNPTLLPAGNIVLAGTGAARTVTVTPATALSGQATVTLTVSDGTTSSSSSFLLTVGSANTPPTLSGIGPQTSPLNTVIGPLSLTVGDLETPVENLTLAAASSNPALLPAANIVFGGSGASRTVTLTPLADQSGVGTVTLTVGDGQTTTSASFPVTVTGGGGSGAGFFLDEGFEGAGYENGGWIPSGFPNPDYTASPLHGAQSLRCLNGDTVSRPFVLDDHFNLYFRARWDTWANERLMLFFWDATFNFGATTFLYATGNKPVFLKRLSQLGIEMPESLFVQRQLTADTSIGPMTAAAALEMQEERA